MKYMLIICAFVALMLLQTVVALPDSGTSLTGNNCLKKHSIRYSYDATAPKSVNIGDTFTVSLDFSLSTESRLRRAPTKTTATLSGTNIQILTNGAQDCSIGAKWQVKATQAGTANLNFDTIFYIDGNDPAHRGYKATFKDTVEVSIQINEIKADPIVVPGPVAVPNQNSTPIEQNTTPVQVVNQTVEQTITTNETCDTNGMQVVTRTFEGGMEPDPEETSWIITRLVGLVAYLFLFLSMLTALLKKAGYTKGLSILFKFHHDISLLSIILALFHGLSNIFDKYMWDLSAAEVFIPRFGTETQILISLGIIGFYIMLVVTLTSIGGAAMKKFGFKKWKLIHMTSYISFVFVFVHSILMGTDLVEGPLSYLFWFSGFIIFIVTIDLLIMKFLGGKK